MDTSIFNIGSTERVERLRDKLYEQALKNRASEWFRDDMFPDIGEKYPDKPVIIRRAYAIKAMLKAMTNEKNSADTHSYEINDGELIVGVLPMGSNGLGKVFPNYLTEDEKRVGTITNRTELSLLGHNTADYDRLVKHGIQGILDKCSEKIREIETSKAKRKPLDEQDQKNKLDFYRAVEISCEAVVAYANRFADLAGEQAKREEAGQRRRELLEIERICRKVPLKAADTFHEALQSIWFVHVALHSSMNFISFGRLDQVLQPYLNSTVREGEKDIRKALELLECFMIKSAWRLNLTTEYLVEQDHMDYNAALGIHPYYLDQRAGTNNFLQNIIVGGRKKDGSNAANECTYLILQALANVNLSTPGVYVRMGEDSPRELKRFVAEKLLGTKNIPGILNDDVLIPAIHTALVEGKGQDDGELQEVANDYCVDGCWEPILNGISDWTFGMINGMTILECSLNKGATLDPNPGMLRGDKLSFSSGDIKNYEHLKTALRGHLQFFVDQSVLGLYKYYMLDEFVNPSPLFSAFLGTCLEKGRDKSWGGTKYNLGGTILGGVPDMVNTICAIRKWVFDENTGKYDLGDVLAAMRYNYRCPDDTNIKMQRTFDNIRVDFSTNSPKFGNNDKEANEVTREILGYYYEAIQESRKLADRVFLIKPEGEDEEQKVKRLRLIAGYYGKSLQEKFGQDFAMTLTAGCGTFEQYTLQGSTIAASADRDAGTPLAPNFTPAPGTVQYGAAHVLASFEGLGLERFAAGAIADICLEDAYKDPDVIEAVIEQFIENKGNMLTISIGDRGVYQQIYEMSVAASRMADREAASRELGQYANINVRVGGWQAPFISMAINQQENYINRPIPVEGKE